MNKFIEWEDLDLHKTTGKENLRCPNCDDVRTNKKDKSLKINHDNGMGKCFYCEVLTFREDDKSAFKATTFDLPQQTWVNYTNIPDTFIKALEQRKIQQFAIKDLGVTVEKFYQPKLNKEVDNLVFNYFERDKVISKKYRGANKSFTQSKNTKNIFYNINSVIGQKEVYIVEGEFDVLAMWSHGVKNCISVPNGANDNDDYWANSEPYLKDIEKFIIAVDNDEKGNVLRDKIVQRLGRYRCEFIEWETGKDANDCLIKGTLEKELSNSRRFPVSGTFSVSDLYTDILELHKNGLPDTIQVKNECFTGGENVNSFNDAFTIMRGHLVTGTGIPSHGKSNFTEWYALNLMNDNDLKFSFFSPEHSPMALHQTNFIQKAVGKPFFGNVDGVERINEKDIERYKEWADGRLYLTAPESGHSATWSWLLEKFKEQMFSFGVDCFVIDAFNKVKLPKGVNKLDAINDVLTDLTAFAQTYNVVIILIAHPTKMQKGDNGLYSMPSLYDVSGSSDFRNQTHDGFCVYRYFDTQEQEGYTRFTNLKTKMSFQGVIGDGFDFNYDVPTGRYYAKGTDVPRFDMTRKDEVQSELNYKPTSTITPNDSFESDFNIENNEVPF